MWTVEADTNDLIQGLLDAPKPPAATTKVGNTQVSWWEGKAGDAVVMAEGGSPEDRWLGEKVVATQLEAIGYKRASFTFDSNQHTAGWPDIEQKAKRLIQSGNVTLLRNGWNNIVAHVIGDHGEYNAEIGRDDPESRAISTWQCECPWDQYAWQRTRKWKKYEGRPCSHVLAAFWQSQATPLDEAPPSDQNMPPGQRMKALPETPAPSGGGNGGAGRPGMPSPGGEPAPVIPAGGFSPDEAMGTSTPIPGNIAPPGESGVLPMSPMDQLSQMQPPIPGATPGGMPANPAVVSVPGAKPPTPFNPIQFPGGTYSNVNRLQQDAQEVFDGMLPEWETMPDDFYCQPQAERMTSGLSERGHNAYMESPYGHTYTVVESPYGKFIVDPYEQNGPPKLKIWPYGQVPADQEPEAYGGFHEGSAPEEPPNYRKGTDNKHCGNCKMNDHGRCWGYGNKSIQPGDVCDSWYHESKESKTAAEEFAAPQIVRLKVEGYGMAEGKSEEHGSGQYKSIPMGSTGEVLYQDPATGWVEVIFPLHESSYLEPYHVRMFCDPSDLAPTNTAPPGPFIKRR